MFANMLNMWMFFIGYQIIIHKRQKYPWVLPIGTTSKNGEGTKNDQIIFLGPFKNIFSQL